ncbi:MAG: dihydropteroate synthase [bacterium]|nr:dihydropteroate synthase [bacterium]
MNIKLVGILNVTPDSFSDTGKYLDPNNAIVHAKKLFLDGAHVIDIGGQSSGPGSLGLSHEIEWLRIKDVVQEVCKFIKVSIDTYHPEIAEKSLAAGASIINDITAARSADMLSVIKGSNAKIVLMYSAQRLPHDFSHLETKNFPRSFDIIREISEFFKERVEMALSKGVNLDQIILDPSMGAFISADSKISWDLISRFAEFKSLGLPIMFASSRKGFLKRANEVDPKDRDPLSALTGFLVAQKLNFTGPDYIRTHNVALQKDFLCFQEDSL